MALARSLFLHGGLVGLQVLTYPSQGDRSAFAFQVCSSCPVHLSRQAATQLDDLSWQFPDPSHTVEPEGTASLAAA